MRTRLLLLLQAACLILLSTPSRAQTIPSDFKFTATVGGLAPWEEKTTLTIDNAGQAHAARYMTGGTPAILAETTFTVTMPEVEKLWKMIQDSSFFTLASRSDTTAQDGEFEKITVTANGTVHQVVIRNAAEPKLDGILEILNAVVPPAFHLSYTPPGSLNIIPRDPCSSPSGKRARGPQADWPVRMNHPVDPKAKHWFDAHSTSVAGTGFALKARLLDAGTDLPHPGTTIAYTIPLEDAVKQKVATLSSKGEYFGDDVSITVNNTVTPPSNTVTITLYLEFYGPQATQANIDKIEFDIAKKWGGLKTSSGKTVDLEFVTRADANTTSPPATPGFHEIRLVPKDSVRSVVTGGPKANEGTGGGTWAVDAAPGTYGHEAGHLMGLPDRYTDFNKQADGSWKNAKTGDSYPNNDAFATYVASKYPGMDMTTIKNALNTMDTYSVPLDGSENDLMANVSKPPRQSDIDQLTSAPGVLVTVPPGSVMVNRKGDDQNLIVTRRDDLFVKPGETRTQNGIFAACIDHHRGIPTKDVLFDITPPLTSWTGIASAAPMAQLARYIDSAGLYCGNNFATQEAIWRISDNSQPLFSNDVDEILAAAGISLGSQIMDFPHLTGGTFTDSSARVFIPNELFVAHITPRFIEGQVGNAVTLHASVFTPAHAAASTPAYSWTALAPDGTPGAITASDSTGALTPQRSGIYSVALQFSYHDSLSGPPRSFPSERKAYVIVPDNYTETFEHATLADKFPWTSMGDVPWTVTDTLAETGRFAAQPSALPSGGQSTLAITLSVPADTAIIFSVRTALASFDFLDFYIDSVWTDAFSGLSDWQIRHYPLAAGRHLLQWSYAPSEGATVPGSVWLDNIFFPGNVVVTSVAGETAALPHTFVLEQNYPNPFNPATVIRYALPRRAQVSLVIYNELGQKVAQLVDATEEAGYHDVAFDASKLSSGVYFYTLRAEEFTRTLKLLLIK